MLVIESIGGGAKYTGASIDNLSAKGVACVTRDGAASAAADFIHFCCFCAERMSRYRSLCYYCQCRLIMQIHGHRSGAHKL